MAIYCSDTFTRADGPLGSTEVGGGAWVVSAGGWGILDNQARFNGSSDSYAVVDSGQADNYEVKFTVTALSTFGAYPVAIVPRASSSSAWVKIYRDNDLGKWVLANSSGYNSPATSTTPNLSRGSVVAARVTGSDFSLLVNGSLVATWTAVPDSHVGSSMQGVAGSGNHAVTVDDYAVADIRIGATLGGSLGGLTGSLAATYIAPPPAGSIAGAFSGLAGSFVGDYTAPPPVGALAGTFPALTGSLAGDIPLVIGTSDRYANDGYNYDGTAEVEFDVPVAATPARVRRSKIRRVHQSLPAPTLVDGRPT